MITVKIGKQEMQLFFPLSNMDALEQLMGEPLTISNLMKRMNDRHFIIDTLLIMLRDEDGSAPDYATQEWMGRHVYPKHLNMLQVAILDTITDAMTMETAQDDEEEETDEILEELKKKDEPEASPIVTLPPMV